MASDETLKDGIDAIIDAQKCNWRSVKATVDTVTNSLDSKLRKLYVVRPDGFWDKQRLENCAKSQKNKDVSHFRNYVYSSIIVGHLAPLPSAHMQLTARTSISK